jgi:hypothetical protein
MAHCARRYRRAAFLTSGRVSKNKRSQAFRARSSADEPKFAQGPMAARSRANLNQLALDKFLGLHAGRTFRFTIT